MQNIRQTNSPWLSGILLVILLILAGLLWHCCSTCKREPHALGLGTIDTSCGQWADMSGGSVTLGQEFDLLIGMFDQSGMELIDPGVNMTVQLTILDTNGLPHPYIVIVGSSTATMSADNPVIDMRIALMSRGGEIPTSVLLQVAVPSHQEILPAECPVDVVHSSHITSTMQITVLGMLIDCNPPLPSRECNVHSIPTGGWNFVASGGSVISNVATGVPGHFQIEFELTSSTGHYTETIDWSDSVTGLSGSFVLDWQDITRVEHSDGERITHFVSICLN